MADLFTVENFLTLCMLVLLQAVLGFDNLLYISLESKNAPDEKQPMVRMVGIGGAIVLRIGLLFLLMSVVSAFQEPFWKINMTYLKAEIKVGALITLAGGIFILYTAIKEIFHMLRLKNDYNEEEKKKKSVGMVIFWIVLMNMVFSFDSILSAMALTDNTIVMSTAIVIGGIMMIWLSNTISNFLKKNRLYEVLGLFILFVVGIMLVSEGGHDAHLEIFGNHISSMSKTTFYFIILIMVLIDIVQGRYQKKIMAEREAAIEKWSNESGENPSSSTSEKA